MKRFLFIMAIFCVLKTNAQNYLITFEGTGASTTVSTVKIENLTAGTSLIMSGSDILHLKAIVTGVGSLENQKSPELKIYPNPMTGNSIFEIFPPEAGDATISVYDITGKPIVQNKYYLENSLQKFRLSGINRGFYLIRVNGYSYQYSGKLLCNGKADGTISIEKISNIQAVDEKKSKIDHKGTQATVDMLYTNGDRLKYTGTSGSYSTVKMDIPITDRTITFNFISCTDGDNNNYPVLEIGTQVWMAENLRTTRYSNGINIPLVTDNTAWLNLTTPGYCWYNNNEAAYKATYGALYNWYTVNTGNLCPAGWYIPADDEWTILTDYLTNNGYGYQGSGNDIAKSIAATSGWSLYSTAGSVGNILSSNNSSGFTALPSNGREGNGLFGSVVGNSGRWWSSSGAGASHAWERHMNYNSDVFYRSDANSGNGTSVRCLQGEPLPILTTTVASNITQNTAASGGDVISDGGSNITSRGVCWSTSANPTIADNHTSDGTDIGVFSSNLTELTLNTKYYVRAYATCSVGTSYGNEIFFATRGSSGTVSDTDGNTYSTIEIGNQIWMAENLKTTKYSDGTEIPLVTTDNEWIGLSTPAFCWYNNDAAANKTIFGGLYNWYTVNTFRLCPSGWHVPTDNEWTTLITFLGGQSIAGGKLKETGTTHWQSPNMGATNETGFTALPGGSRSNDASFIDVGYLGKWWSSTEENSVTAFGRVMTYFISNADRLSYTKTEGRSVRCLQGELQLLPILTTTAIGSITQTTATTGGVVTSDGGAGVTARGVCWSTLPNPAITDNKTSDGTGTGTFTSAISGLTVGTIYYVRSYATNSVGTAYGNEISFATQPNSIIFNPDLTYGTISDIDGNVYKTIVIGTQVWMAENLKTTKYQNGDLIGTTTPVTLDISSEATPKYQWANNGFESNVGVYGRLYTWYAVNDSRKVCPVDWHVPTDTEWTALITFLGGQNVAGGKLKETGTTHWLSPNTGASNETGFTSLAGGYRDPGAFDEFGSMSFYWSSTEYDSNNSRFRFIFYNASNVGSSNGQKRFGFPVRCLRDN